MRVSPHLKNIFLLIIVLSQGCGPVEFTPWQTNLPAGMRDSTLRNLQLLEGTDQKLPFTMGLLGDPQGTPGDLQALVGEMNKYDVKFSIVLGDLTDFGLKDEFVDTYEALEELKSPYLTVIGNHDALALGKTIYREMFGPFDYTFQYAGIKFVMWNTNKFEFGTANFEYLEAEVTEHAVVATHIVPVVDVHSQEEIDRWFDIYRNAKIMTSLHGHRGTIDSFRLDIENIPIYTVAKVSGVHFALVRFNEDYTVEFIDCNGTCDETF